MRYIKKLFKLDFVYLAILFVFWRLFLFIIAFIAPWFVSRWGGRFPYADEQLLSTNLPYWLWVWGNFDGVHYLTIAKSSYLAYFTQTFFPLYPLLIRFLSKIIFDNYLVAGLLISNVAFLIALYFLNKLLIFEGYGKSNKWIIAFLLFFPTSFYFGAIYTEGIFLLLVVLSFYLVKINKWFLAGIIGAFASATRLFGILLLPALLLEYIIQYKKKKDNPTSIFFLLLIPLGLFAYMYYLNDAFKDPLLFWHAQPAFGAGRTGSGIIFPPQVIFRYFKILFSVKFFSTGFLNALFELSSFFFAIIVLGICHLKRIRISYLLFSWLSLILPTLTGTFSSLPRYILIIFPIFIALGTIKNNHIKTILLALNICILFIAAVFYTRGYWVS